MAGRYVAPEYGLPSFTCPYPDCQTLAPQVSSAAFMQAGAFEQASPLVMTRCGVCGRPAVWVSTNRLVLPPVEQAAAALKAQETVERVPQSRYTMVYPASTPAPPPNGDLPEDIRQDYEEAADIIGRSPRAAAALLRLCLQKLCVHFGQPGKDINQDIGALVAKGTIRPMVQQAMDTVRISGNESVHPGELNLDDDQELALALFIFINLIADEAITQPKKVEAIYNKMPEPKRNGVAQRDGTPPSGTPTKALDHGSEP